MTEYMRIAQHPDYVEGYVVRFDNGTYLHSSTKAARQLYDAKLYKTTKGAERALTKLMRRILDNLEGEVITYKKAFEDDLNS